MDFAYESEIKQNGIMRMKAGGCDKIQYSSVIQTMTLEAICNNVRIFQVSILIMGLMSWCFCWDDVNQKLSFFVNNF